MDSDKIRALIKNILEDVEEEDVGVSLLSRQYQNREELSLFNEDDRQKVYQVLEKLSTDSERHKRMLYELVDFLGEKLHGS